MTEVWSVRGIDPQVRDAVVKTARRRKVAVAAVLQEAVERLLSPPRDSTQESQAILSEGALLSEGARLREIDRHLDQLNARRAGRLGV